MSDVRKGMSSLILCSFLAAALGAVCSCAEDGFGVGDLEVSEPSALVDAPRIERVLISGSGCGDAGASTVGLLGTPDALRIDFADFVASAPEGHHDRQCTVSVALASDDGFAYAPAGLDLDIDTTAVTTASTFGYWTSSPGRKSADTVTLHGAGRVVMTALDDRSLWSSCSGNRELRIAVRLGIEARTGRAALQTLHGLRFYARKCTAIADEKRDAGSDASDAARSAVVPDATVTERPTDGAPLDGSVLEPGPDASISPADAETVLVRSVVATGTGCPESSTAIRIAQSRATFDVDFSQFVAGAATGARASVACALAVELDVPKGKTIALERFTARGAAALPTGGTTRLFATPDFLGGTDRGAGAELALIGPRDGAFELSPKFSENELLFRECEVPRTFLLQLSLSARGPSGTAPGARLDTIGGFSFRVRDCQ